MAQRNKAPDWWGVFATHYIATGNATQSYRKARPEVTEGTAKSEGSLLLTNPRFTLLINRKRKEIEGRVAISRDKWIDEITAGFLSKPIKNPTWSEKGRLGEILGRAQGWLSEEKAASVTVNVAIMEQIREALAGRELPDPTEAELQAIENAVITDE